MLQPAHGDAALGAHDGRFRAVEPRGVSRARVGDVQRRQRIVRRRERVGVLAHHRRQFDEYALDLGVFARRERGQGVVQRHGALRFFKHGAPRTGDVQHDALEFARRSEFHRYALSPESRHHLRALGEILPRHLATRFVEHPSQRVPRRALFGANRRQRLARVVQHFPARHPHASFDRIHERPRRRSQRLLDLPQRLFSSSPRRQFFAQTSLRASRRPQLSQRRPRQRRPAPRPLDRHARVSRTVEIVPTEHRLTAPIVSNARRRARERVSRVSRRRRQTRRRRLAPTSRRPRERLHLRAHIFPLQHLRRVRRVSHRRARRRARVARVFDRPRPRVISRARSRAPQPRPPSTDARRDAARRRRRRPRRRRHPRRRVVARASSNESKSVEKDKSALDRHIATRGSRVARAVASRVRRSRRKDATIPRRRSRVTTKEGSSNGVPVSRRRASFIHDGGERDGRAGRRRG